MGALSFIKKKKFWRMVLLAVLLYILIYFVVVFGLKGYTHHGKNFPVPDFKGLKQDRYEQLAEYNDIDVEIIDSSFVDYLPKGSVIDQYPKPGTRIKKGRTIFLTVNSFNQVKIEVPNVIGMSFRQGKNTLESRGLRVGRLIYKPDFAKNNILNQIYDGKIIKHGQKIEKGQTIDLELGNGLGKTTNLLPDLVGLDYKTAKAKIFDSFFNVGDLIFDQPVKTSADTLKAEVYKQIPTFKEGARSVMGSEITLWLTLSPQDE